MTIWKFPIEVADSQELSMPVGAEILCIQVQHERPTIWAQTSGSSCSGLESKTIRTFATGQLFDAPGPYVGTYQLGNGQFVGHVFEELP